MTTNTAGIITTVESMVAMVAAGRLTGLSTSVQQALHTYDQEADAKLDQLKAALDAVEASNPYVAQTVAALTAIAKAAGFALPDEATVFAHLKGAVDELFGSVETAPAA